MKRNSLLQIFKTSLIIAMSLLTGSATASVFTATASGNFSSSTTWMGGIVPPTTISLDQIIIPAGIEVTLDQDLTISGTLASLAVTGSLVADSEASITLDNGAVTGTGEINVATFIFNSGTAFTFSGMLTANVIQTATDLTTTADMIVIQTLHLASGMLTAVSGGSVNLGAGSTIVIDGGMITVGGGGSIDISSEYNVLYKGESSVAGLELSGPGLNNVTVNVNPQNSVLLTSDLTVNGTLYLTTGVLWLGANDLIVNGDVEASLNGSIYSTATSSIVIQDIADGYAKINFDAGSQINNLSMPSGNAMLEISGDLTIHGSLDFAGIFNFSNTNLALNGQLNGEGRLKANQNSNLTINSADGLLTLKFDAAGQSLNDLMINLEEGEKVSLDSDLSINGTLLINSGDLYLNSNTLTLETSSNITGEGNLIANSESGIIILSSNGISTLNVDGVIGNLNIQVVDTSRIVLGGDVTIEVMLQLTSGIMDLNGFNLSINGAFNTTNSGVIAGDVLSNISISSQTSVSGQLNFNSGEDMLGSLTLNIAGNGSASLGTDLQIENALILLDGKLDIGDNMLSLGANADVSGVDAQSYIIAEEGSVQASITAGAGPVSFPIGTATHYLPAAISLNEGSTSGQVEVSVMSNVLLEGETGMDISEFEKVVDATWNIDSDIQSGLDLNLELMWPAELEVNGFNRLDAYISHFENGEWDINAGIEASMQANGYFSIQREGITSLSPFAVFDANTTTALDDPEADRFTIYPNPADGEVFIQRKTISSDPVRIEVFSQNGQQITQMDLMEPITPISLERFAQGNYIIHLNTSDGKFVKQFSKL